jgi:hypothetical protein
MSPPPEEMISWVLKELAVSGSEGESIFWFIYEDIMHATSTREGTSLSIGSRNEIS